MTASGNLNTSVITTTKVPLPTYFNGYEITSLGSTLIIREEFGPLNRYVSYDAKTNTATPSAEFENASTFIGKNFRIERAGEYLIARDHQSRFNVLLDHNFKVLGNLACGEAFSKLQILNAETLVYFGHTLQLNGEVFSVITTAPRKSFPKDTYMARGPFISFQQIQFLYPPDELFVIQDNVVAVFNAPWSGSPVKSQVEIEHVTGSPSDLTDMSTIDSNLTFNTHVKAVATDRKGKLFFSSLPNYLSVFDFNSRASMTWSGDQINFERMIVRASDGIVFGAHMINPETPASKVNIYAVDFKNGLYYQLPESTRHPQFELLDDGRLAYLVHDFKGLFTQKASDDYPKLALVEAPAPLDVKSQEEKILIAALSENLPTGYVKPLIKLTAEYAYSGLVKSLGLFKEKVFAIKYFHPEVSSDQTNIQRALIK